MVSRKDWAEPAQVALAQDPRLYGRAAGEFYVVYAQLAADKLNHEFSGHEPWLAVAAGNGFRFNSPIWTMRRAKVA